LFGIFSLTSLQKSTTKMGMFKRKITVSDDHVDVRAVHLTLKQSILPNLLVTILFFLWGFAYGLLDVLNSHFQTELNISASRASD
jgi:FHS family L-fucose permease-like MFS transporter